MTSNQANRLVTNWQEKHGKLLKDNPLAEKQGKEWVLTDGGLAIRAELECYEYELAKNCVAKESTMERWPSMAGVMERLRLAATKSTTSVEVPEELKALGHAAVVSLDLKHYRGECYGILELEGQLPGVWVCGIRIRAMDHFVPGAIYKPEWSFLPATKYRFGMASKISDARATEIKDNWRRMDKAHQFDSDCPRHLWWRSRDDEPQLDGRSGMPSGDLEREMEGFGHERAIRETEPNVIRRRIENQVRQLNAAEDRA